MKKKDGKKWGKLTGSMKKSAAYWICGGILVGACGVFTLRLIDWQIINGQEYLNRANQTSVATVSLEAARGEILDVNGSRWQPMKPSTKLCSRGRMWIAITSTT